MRGRGAGDWKFRRQQGIGPYVLDFYCPELRLCVELDGSSHDYRFEYDEQRTAFLGEQDIRVVRFRNEQVWASVEGIVPGVGEFLGGSLVTPEFYLRNQIPVGGLLAS